VIDQTVLIKTARGDSDLMGLMKTIDDSCTITEGDLLYAGQRQRTRILQRTENGVDSENVQFHPYSTKGPYYYYPGKNAKNREGAARSFANKIGLKGKKVGQTASKSRNVTATRTRFGVKFSSYAAFKSYLGRTNVDLRGPSAPHMLQSMIVRVLDITLTLDDSGSFSFDAANQPASQINIGIYGEEAVRASGHNEGEGHLPRRHFMGANDTDKQLVLRDILDRVSFRARKAVSIVR
jgi:hypothetical protein